MPHIHQHKSDKTQQNAQVPHILGTHRVANMVIKPHLSPTWGGVGGVVRVYFDWCIIRKYFL